MGSVWSLKDLKRKGQVSLMQHLWKLIGVLVIGVFVFSIFFSGGGLFNMLESLMDALTGITMPTIASSKASAKALSYAMNCTASQSGDWSDCSSRTFSGGGRNVRVTCEGSAGSEQCYVQGFTLPQPDSGCTDPTCIINRWIIGSGDPNVLLYYEKFPSGVQQYWQPTGFDVLLMQGALMATTELATFGLAPASATTSSVRRIASVETAGNVVSKMRRIGRGSIDEISDILVRSIPQSMFSRRAAETQLQAMKSQLRVNYGDTSAEMLEAYVRGTDYGPQGYQWQVMQRDLYNELAGEGVPPARRREVLDLAMALKDDLDVAFDRNSYSLFRSVIENAGGATSKLWDDLTSRVYSSTKKSSKILENMPRPTRQRMKENIRRTFTRGKWRKIWSTVKGSNNLYDALRAADQRAVSENVIGYRTLKGQAKAFCRMMKGCNPASWSRKKQVAYTATSAIAITSWYLDSKSSKFEVCGSNSLCLKFAGMTNVTSYKLVPGIDRPSIKVPGLGILPVVGKSISHEKFYTGSPCRADLKVSQGAKTTCWDYYPRDYQYWTAYVRACGSARAVDGQTNTPATIHGSTSTWANPNYPVSQPTKVPWLLNLEVPGQGEFVQSGDWPVTVERQDVGNNKKGVLLELPKDTNLSQIESIKAKIEEDVFQDMIEKNKNTGQYFCRTSDGYNPSMSSGEFSCINVGNESDSAPDPESAEIPVRASLNDTEVAGRCGPGYVGDGIKVMMIPQNFHGGRTTSECSTGIKINGNKVDWDLRGDGTNRVSTVEVQVGVGGKNSFSFDPSTQNFENKYLKSPNWCYESHAESGDVRQQYLDWTFITIEAAVEVLSGGTATPVIFGMASIPVELIGTHQLRNADKWPN